MSGEATALSSSGADASGNRADAYSPLPARRGTTDTDRRRMSLAAQRRQSSTQVTSQR